jgi:hypothetical protein
VWIIDQVQALGTAKIALRCDCKNEFTGRPVNFDRNITIRARWALGLHLHVHHYAFSPVIFSRPGIL